jgi:hydroxyacylglutathione hydrolase
MKESNATILQLPLGPLQTNCYLLACNETGMAAVIDPSWDGRLLYEKAIDEGWTISDLLLTHSHFDHVGGLAEIKALSSAPISIHPDAVGMLENAVTAANLWQITIPEPPPVDRLLADGDKINVGNLQLDVLFTPGHAPGHVCYYLKSEGVLFDGDVLFQQSIGRTDLPGGDYQLLINSIKTRLLTLPDETIVLSGHGPVTTIGQERGKNPFLLQAQ